MSHQHSSTFQKVYKQYPFTGPFSTKQLINKTKWVLITTFPLVYMYGYYTRKLNIVTPPLLDNTPQNFDQHAFEKFWKISLQPLQAVWSDETKLKNLPKDVSSEVLYLKKFTLPESK